MIKDINTFRKTMLLKQTSLEDTLEKQVKSIINRVKKDGDVALKFYTETFDETSILSFQVLPVDIAYAYTMVSKNVIDSMKKAMENIKKYHRFQKYQTFEYEVDGKVIGQKVTPIEKVGLYIPGGTAAYPSTVLMSAIPAIIAGVKDIILISPPNKEGRIAPSILVAADILGITNIYKVGGAQGIAALAYGTASIPKVDKIVGPGNQYVATAKKLVSGIVGIDTIAGPSEVVIFADANANPNFIAADMLAQAEHDVQAKAICISTSKNVLEQVEKELSKQLQSLSRASIATQ